ncbi:MAG: ATPase, T2SS/T4P/T4SS family [Anaerolineales bacterium]
MTEQIIDVNSKRVLIVDDNPGMFESLAEILETRGFFVGVAQDGRAAVEEMREKPYDLFLIDIMMPGMNGVETLRQIKSINPDAITLIMTGQSQVEDLMSEALWSGVDGVLYKPFDVDDVLDMIRQKYQEQMAHPLISLKKYNPDPAAIEMVPERMARRYEAFPLRIEEGQLVVAMVDPTHLQAIEDLRIRTSLSIRPLRASRDDIEAAFARYYQHTGEIERQVRRISSAVDKEDVDLRQRLSVESVSQTPVARTVELLVHQAVKDKASDIHLEPQEDSLRVRYRIDGVLHEVMSLPLRIHAAMLSRIKILSDLNIAERRRPQDGQFSIEVEGKQVDVRVATINTVHGEMAVLRVLDKSVSVLSLEELGFLSDGEERYRRIITAPWGIVLLAGPTGSGKTSTLYASINQLDKDENKIITIEDPVEYRFEGINQVQVNRQAGITFASGLRAAMRLDPNIILVGEIRDEETARIAVQASLTGHLVFSSIHANDSVGAILRLIDLGVEPFLVSSSLLGIVSQRLVRRVCSECHAPEEVSERERMVYEREMGESKKVFEYGQGCSNCAQTGYRGRVGVFEILIMNDEIRRLVVNDASTDEVIDAARHAGMRPMIKDGMIKAKRGVTTPSEVVKNIFALH